MYRFWQKQTMPSSREVMDCCMKRCYTDTLNTSQYLHLAYIHRDISNQKKTNSFYGTNKGIYRHICFEHLVYYI